ncbi:Molybdenum cofactor guanylyltransferase [subsurface metagenome]
MPMHGVCKDSRSHHGSLREDEATWQKNCKELEGVEAVTRSKSTMMISVILLAAGRSKRMGKLKQVMPFGQSTVLGQAINNLLASVVSELIVVVGYRAKEVIRSIATEPVKLVINPDYGQGMSTSIIVGLNLVDSRAQAVMLALGDQPLINSQIVNRLIEEFCNHDKGIAVPIYQGRRGHPIIFASKYKEKLLELDGDIGGRQIVKDHPDDILEVAVNSESIITDIDTISDYQSQAD